MSENFAALGNRLTCADMTVPLDWSSPERGKVSVSLVRVAAASPKERQGAIFFNPGGPGGDGLAFASAYATAWGKADPKTNIGSGLNKMTQAFDLIGFSPRGVGASTRLYCGTNQLVRPARPPSADRSEDNIQRMIRAGQLLASACKKNPVTPFINTDATARDLNLARQLLGDDKLNYVGYSYGTWLGSWYAKLFPEHTGRMLLDGNMAWQGEMEETFKLQPMAFERDFREVYAAYVARHDEVFGLGHSAEEVYASWRALGEPVRSFTG